MTAHVGDEDLYFFNELRTRFFPRERNFLRAHVTMFHRLAPEHRLQIDDILRQAGRMTGTVEVKVTGVRNMGNGVSFVLESEILARVREDLRAAFRPWLGPQDLQPWRPHVTVQNKVHWQQADALYDMLSSEFVVEGFDLWSYMQGPWRHEHFFRSGQTADEPL
ncbi:2'-5' RNA ligase family protein [Rhizobium lentis]|uniref:2'-5' RNA ligase family protein n=1 Tax=Rhizobium lentis TaxID=1138194 RepID=UPI001C83E4CF|nr:2'-5' RNA ligase family protein [Rhizobium lentis]MBX5132711.1 2'-5' RNA ligase family protein [Rhizobium lentis]